MAKKVFLGVGHGGSDPGAVANGFKEKDLNLAIAHACMNELTRHGVTVGMSRVKDENDSLVEEIKECNAFAPDLAVEIHNNAGGGDGIEVFHTYLLGKGKTLAQNIINEVVKLGQNSRGTKIRKNAQGTDYFGWIRQCKAPAVLVECAFMDTKDIEIIDTLEEQKVMGVAIAKGILTTLGIAWIAEANKINNPPKDETTHTFAPYAVKVNTTSLNVRKGAGTNYAIVGTVKKGQVYTILEEATGTGAKKWGKIKSGWISLDYCILEEPTKEETTFTPYKVKVDTSVLNIRKNPGTNYPIVDSIKDKGIYTIVEEATGKGANKWGKLKSGVGWISLDYCKKV